MWQKLVARAGIQTTKVYVASARSIKCLPLEGVTSIEYWWLAATNNKLTGIQNLLSKHKLFIATHPIKKWPFVSHYEQVNEGCGCIHIRHDVTPELKHDSTGFLQLQLCLENPTDVCSIVYGAKIRHSVTVSKDWLDNFSTCIMVTNLVPSWYNNVLRFFNTSVHS